MGNKFNCLTFEIGKGSLLVLQEESLLNISQFTDFLSALYGFGYFHHSELAHTVNTKVGFGIHQNAWFQAIVPVVVVCYSP